MSLLSVARLIFTRSALVPWVLSKYFSAYTYLTLQVDIGLQSNEKRFCVFVCFCVGKILANLDASRMSTNLEVGEEEAGRAAASQRRRIYHVSTLRKRGKSRATSILHAYVHAADEKSFSWAI